MPVAALEPGARLLHVGIPKTGTTALQHAASTQREELLAHGVCYPGTTTNHREAVCALMGRQLGWKGAGAWIPDQRLWRALVAELDRHPECRGFVSHEFASESTREQARRFADSLGDRLHVVITLRGFAHLLASSWQQGVKAGRRRPYEGWLRDVLATPPRGRAADHFYRRNDQADVVQRWVDVVGGDAVTVVVADKRDPTLLTGAFEQLLGLPDGLLGGHRGGLAVNRSMSLAEAELLRRLNGLVRKPLVEWHQYDALVRNGGVARLLERRRPARGEVMVGLPDWAVEPATTRAAAYAEAIGASGCRVVGDLATLTDPVRPAGARLPRVEQVPIDAAVELAAGLVSAALGRGPYFDVTETPMTTTGRRLARSRRGRRVIELTHRTQEAPLGDLVGMVALRAVRGVLRR